MSRLRSEQEQDEANAVKWMNETPNEDILRVWLAIQKMGGDSMTEVISRFSQLGMTHAALLAGKDLETTSHA